jgi:hypothetical protein
MFIPAGIRDAGCPNEVIDRNFVLLNIQSNAVTEKKKFSQVLAWLNRQDRNKDPG